MKKNHQCELDRLRADNHGLTQECDDLNRRCGRLEWALKRIGYINGVGIPKHNRDADIARIALASESKREAAGTADEKPGGQAENANSAGDPLTKTSTEANR